MGNARADADEGAERAHHGEHRGGQEEGQRGVDAVEPAGHVVTHLVRQQDSQQSHGEAEPGVRVEGNRILEDNFIPTKENRDKYKLGDIIEIRFNV